MNFKPFTSINLAATLFATFMLGSTSHAQLQKNVMFVLDASNSMWGQIDGKSKIEIAKSVLKDLTADMPKTAKLGLIAYGHRFDRKLNECDDMELMNPIGHFSSGEADNAFSFITPKGQTPIANTLQETAGWMAEHKGQDNTVVLISDGLESCDGDPCAAAKALNDAGITTKIHVVGFDLSSSQRAKLECIAANGNGKMYAANDAQGLSDVMKEVRAEVEQSVAEPIVVAEAPVKPAKPEVETVFEDQFEGDDLAEGWVVSNPNPDRYIAEAGELLIVAGAPASHPQQEEMENVISHEKALPKGDWDIEIKFKAELQQGSETLYFGVRNDHENWLAAGIMPSMEYGASYLKSFIEKNERGTLTRFDNTLDEITDSGSQSNTQRWRNTGFSEKYSGEDFVLTLSKRGRSYTLSGRYANDGHENFVQFNTESLKMLRGKKNLFIGFPATKEGRDFQGEGSAYIDYIKVHKITQQE